MREESNRRMQAKRGKILGIATSTAIVLAVVGVFYYSPNASLSSAQLNEEVHGEPLPPDLPHETDVRTGIPILRAVEVINPAESLYFYPIKEGEHEYLWRAVEKGSTFLSNEEMETYFTSFNEKGYRFAMQTDDSTQFYRIRYSEPPISVDTHWVKVFVYDEHKQDAKALSESDKNRLALALDRQYRWVPVDDEAATSIVDLIETEGQNFRTITKEGDRSFQLMYLGPLSEELKQPEFQAMYNLNSEAGQ